MDVIFLPFAAVLTALGLVWAFVWIRGTIREVATASDMRRAAALSFAATYVLVTFGSNLFLLGDKPYIALLVGLLGALAVTALVLVLSMRRIGPSGTSATNKSLERP